MQPKGWTTREKLALFRAYLNNSDWDKRAAEVAKKCGSQRAKNFFSPTACRTEFNRLFALPFPGMMPLEVGIAYSHRFHVEQYIKYLEKELIEDEAREEEVDLATIRNKIDTLLRIKRGEVGPDEMRDLLEQLRMEDAEKDQAEVEMVVGIYMKRLEEVQRGEVEVPPIPPEWTALTLLPPSSIAEQVPRGLETAFRSPSPQKPVQFLSPIRPIRETLQEALQERNPNKEEPEAQVPEPTVEEEAKEPEEEEEEEEEVQKVEEEQNMDTNETPEREPKIEMVDDRSESGSVTSSIAPATPMPIVVPVLVAPSEVESKRRGRPRLNTTSSNRSTRSSAEPETRSRRPSKTDETPKAGTPVSGRRPSLRRPSQLTGQEEPTLMAAPLIPSGPAEEDSGTTTRSKDRRSSRKKKEPTSITPVSVKTEDEESLKTPVDAATDQSIADTLVVDDKRSLAVATEISIYSTKLLPAVSASKKQNVRRSTRVHQPTSAAREGQCKTSTGCQTSAPDFGTHDEFLILHDDHGCKRLKRPFVHVFPIDSLESDDEALISLKRRVQPSKEEVQSEKKKGSSQRNEKRKIKGKLISYKELSVKKEPEDLSQSPQKKKEEKLSKDDQLNVKTRLHTYLTQILANRSASIFRNPVTDREAPDYSKIVKKPMDLTTIKTDIEKGKIISVETLKHRLLQMFANAVMFNYTEHDVNNCAKMMAHDTIDIMRRFNDTNLKTRQLHPVSKRLSRMAGSGADETITSTPGGSVRRDNNGRPRVFSMPQLGTRREVRVGLIAEDDYPRLIPDINLG